MKGAEPQELRHQAQFRPPVAKLKARRCNELEELPPI